MLHAARSLARTPYLLHTRRESLRGATRARTLQAMDSDGGFQATKQDKKKAKNKEHQAKKKLAEEQQAYEAQLAKIKFSDDFLYNHTAASEQDAEDQTRRRGGNVGSLNTVIDLGQTSLQDMRKQIYEQCGSDQHGPYTVDAARWLFNVATNGDGKHLVLRSTYDMNVRVHLKSHKTWNSGLLVTGVAGEDI